MNQLVNIQLGARPAHLSQADTSINRNAANWASGFPVMSLRGKVWRVRQGGTETDITGPGHGGAEVPVPVLPVVIVGIAYGNAKQFYLGGYDENQRGRRPDCFSIDGVTPDAAAANKQHPNCATCRHNQWGTATNSPSGKGKACRDHKRIAIVPAGDIDNTTYGGPMLLALPPMSAPNLKAYCLTLERFGAAANQVVTLLAFDPSATAPTVTFTTNEWLSAADYARVAALGASDQVHQMLEQEWGDAEDASPASAPAGGVNLPSRPAPASAPAASGIDYAQAAKQVAAQTAAAQAAAQQAAAQQAAATQAAAQGAPPRRPSPFAMAAAAQPQPAPQTAPQAAPAATPAAAHGEPAQDVQSAPATVVQGAPANMQEAIDKLLNG
jgi:hypothetical protein